MPHLSVLVTRAPYDHQGARDALEYCRAALASQVATLTHVFFYQQGVYNGNSLQYPPGDELDLYRHWCQLNEDYGVRLLTCITAASRRGIISEEEAAERKADHFTLAKPFEQVGLGEFFTLLHDADRLVQF